MDSERQIDSEFIPRSADFKGYSLHSPTLPPTSPPFLHCKRFVPTVESQSDPDMLEQSSFESPCSGKRVYDKLSNYRQHVRNQIDLEGRNQRHLIELN